MKHALSTHLFVNHRLTTASLERMLHAGVELAEIFCARQHFDYTNRAQVMELSHWLKDSDLTLLSLHSPIYTDDVWGRTGPNSVISITEPVKAKRVLVVDEIRRAIEVAEYVPFRYFVQHIGVSGEPYSDRAVDAAFSSLEELSVFARQRGVEILIENIPNALSSAQRLVEFLARMRCRHDRPDARLAFRHRRKRNPGSHHALVKQRPRKLHRLAPVANNNRRNRSLAGRSSYSAHVEARALQLALEVTRIRPQPFNPLRLLL